LLSFLRRIKILISKQQDYDLAIVHCELFPYLPFFIEKFLLPKKYIYDFDDSFHIKYKNNIFLKNKIYKVIKSAKGISAGNHHLTNFAKNINLNTIHLPTAVNTDVYPSKKIRKKKNSPFIIGWIGSPSTQVYLSEVIDPISKLAEELDITFSIIGAKSPNIRNVKINEILWKKNTYLNEISKFDVGIMPLKDDEWTRGKCAFKLIQYMAIGVPVVCSNVGANKDLVNYSRGFIVRNSSEWIKSFKEIYQNKKKIKKLILNSKKFIRNNYSTKVNIIKFVSIINNSVQR
jgi:glycosyltransferase involved in cell wall biosynthesis